MKQDINNMIFSQRNNTTERMVIAIRREYQKLVADFNVNDTSFYGEEKEGNSIVFRIHKNVMYLDVVENTHIFVSVKENTGDKREVAEIRTDGNEYAKVRIYSLNKSFYFTPQSIDVLLKVAFNRPIY